MLGAEKQICGGGSYSLTELFGGEKIFSTGFAIGFDRTLLALEREGLTAPSTRTLKAYVVPISDAMRHPAYSLVGRLRKEGISADVDLMRRSVGKNLKYADSIGARFVIIVGEKEAAEGAVTLRDLASGEQRLVSLAELRHCFKE